MNSVISGKEVENGLERASRRMTWDSSKQGSLDSNVWEGTQQVVCVCVQVYDCVDCVHVCDGVYTSVCVNTHVRACMCKSRP